MRRILLDQNAPFGLRQILVGYDVMTAYRMGWSALSNGDLMDAAEEAEFSIMLTADQNIRHQQNLSGRRLALIVLATTHWPTIRDHPDRVIAAIEGVEAGGYVVVRFPRPPRRGQVFAT